MQTRGFSAPLPYGVRDIFGAEAAELQVLGDTWRRLFGAWGYDQVITPTYEHYDVLLEGYGREHEEEVYRVLGREGEVLALRPDITTQVARLVGTKLSGGPWPLRLSYVSNVFRFAEPQAGRQREFFQAGVELIGAATAEADAEAVELVVESLAAVGLREFQINLGHIGLFQGVIADLNLPPTQVEGIRRAIDRKDTMDLERALATTAIPPATCDLLRALPMLCNGASVLDRAFALVGQGRARQSLENLATIFGLLQRRGVAHRLILDLGEVRGMDYYTGLSFEGFVAGLGFPICSGGRYDNLVGLYGPAAPAVGFAIGVERVQMALDKQRVRPGAQVPALLIAAEATAACLERVRAWRSLGMRVEVDVLPRNRQELLAYAQQRGIRRVVWSAGPEGMVLLEGRRARRLSCAELDQEVMRWLA